MASQCHQLNRDGLQMLADLNGLVLVPLIKVLNLNLMNRRRRKCPENFIIIWFDPRQTKLAET